ncbi:hypothetical protein [Rhizobium favelukesii]|nr:hypothetical protein [Rhizobium favelukesii]MCS0463586.1 hypothetical protein [Rhizobium favelukesii]
MTTRPTPMELGVRALLNPPSPFPSTATGDAAVAACHAGAVTAELPFERP